MLRNLAKAVGAFIVGGWVALFFEEAVEEMAMVVLIPVTVLGFFLLIFGYAPEVRHWWWMRKQKPMTFDLVVVQRTGVGVDSFYAEHQGWERSLFSVTWDKGYKNKFAVKPGDKVRVTGKMAKRMTDGLNTLVECNVLLLKNKSSENP